MWCIKKCNYGLCLPDKVQTNDCRRVDQVCPTKKAVCKPDTIFPSATKVLSGKVPFTNLNKHYTLSHVCCFLVQFFIINTTDTFMFFHGDNLFSRTNFLFDQTVQKIFINFSIFGKSNFDLTQVRKNFWKKKVRVT